MGVPVPPAIAGSEEASILLFAARAWRRDRNAKRAAKLLDYYLERYPQGSFVEEALGLAIEANAALGIPRAASLSEIYLKRFPDGRFGHVARDALRRFESGTDH